MDNQLGLGYLDRGTYRTFEESFKRARDPKRKVSRHLHDSLTKQCRDYGRIGGICTRNRYRAKLAKLDLRPMVTVRY